jgi:hypothetical protein
MNTDRAVRKIEGKFDGLTREGVIKELSKADLPEEEKRHVYNKSNLDYLKRRA